MSHSKQEPQNYQQEIKRFVAPTMSRALQLVREEMGPEAVILSSKRIDEGVEIITSLQPDLPTRGIDVRREFGQNFDAELDRAMPSDTAWRTEAGVQQAAAAYPASVERNRADAQENPRDRRARDIAQEIEQARERMFEAKRQEESRAAALTQTQAEQKPSKAIPSPIHPGASSRHSDALPEHAAPKNRSADESYAQHAPSQPFEHHFVNHPSLKNQARDNLGVQQQSMEQHGFQEQDIRAEDNRDEQRLHELQRELADMRMLLEQQLWRASEQPDAQKESAPDFVPSQRSKMLDEHLSRLGLSAACRQWLVHRVPPRLRMSDAWRESMAQLSRAIPIAGKDLVSEGGIFAFLGPTGVGKTTTIAKLAARYVLQHGPGKVAIVTTDTHRVGAHDQLRSIGRILSVPVRVLAKGQDLVSTLVSLKSFPLVLIDTAGFRHGDPMLKQQLAILDQCPGIARLLVLAANSQHQALKASFHAYAGSQPASNRKTDKRQFDACVLTKLDETESLGESISILLDQAVPLAYTTNGQEIPKDIELAAGHRLVVSAVSILRHSPSTEPVAG